METFGKECQQNFNYIKVQTKYEKLLQEKSGGDSEIQKTYNYAEISSSSLYTRTDTDGQIFYDVNLRDTDFTKESINSTEINPGDFVLKITDSRSTSTASFIRIPAHQIVSERSLTRKSAGFDSLDKFTEYAKKHGTQNYI